MAKSLIVQTLARVRSDGELEELTFTEGVNVIVGDKNTGKTVWMRMLDFVLGDTGRVEDTFDEELVIKYSSITASVKVGEELFELTRFLSEPGTLTKVFINGEPMPVAEFSSFILSKLGIPILHFPLGSPYAERSWPELSWKTLSRHLYRREEFWQELADKQPEFQQHVCLLQFLGIAPKLFPAEYETLVQKRRSKLKLEARKEQFLDTLEQIAKEIADSADLTVAPTYPSIDEAIANLHTRISNLSDDREKVLSNLRNDVGNVTDVNDGLDQLSNRWAEAQEKRDGILPNIQKAKARVSELDDYRQTILHEIERLNRAVAAGSILGDIEVTRCPVCDQTVRVPEDAIESSCYLCHREVRTGSESEAQARIDFELSQLTEEARELESLIKTIRIEIVSSESELRDLNRQIAELTTLLKPARKASAAILPPELLIIDRKIGSIEERIAGLGRIRKALETRDDLSHRIDLLEQELRELDREILAIAQDISFESANDEMEEGMNTYLNSLNAEANIRWTEPRVTVKLSERASKFLVNDASWKIKLGATMKAYFLLAYHFALMGLSCQDDKNYPGFLMLDFPLNFEDKTSVADKENYLIEPFNQLFSTLECSAQVIVAGRSFEGLRANRIELTEIWS